MNVKEKFKLYKHAKLLLDTGSLPNVFYHAVKIADAKKELLKEIPKGCGRFLGYKDGRREVNCDRETSWACKHCQKMLTELRSEK